MKLIDDIGIFGNNKIKLKDDAGIFTQPKSKLFDDIGLFGEKINPEVVQHKVSTDIIDKPLLGSLPVRSDSDKQKPVSTLVDDIGILGESIKKIPEEGLSVSWTSPKGYEKPPDPSYTDVVKHSWKLATLSEQRGKYGAQLMWGQSKDPSAIFQSIQEIDKNIQENTRPEMDIKFLESPGKYAVGSATKFGRSILSGTKEAAKLGIAAGVGVGTIGAVTGVGAIPLAAGAFAVGSAYGIMKYSMDIEGGNLYVDLIKEGIDPKIARPVSIGAGVAIGAVEVMQIGQILKRIPGAKKLVGEEGRKVIVKKVVPLIRQAVTRYFGDIGVQTGEEVIQETTTIGAEILSRKLQSKLDGKEAPKINYKEIAQRLGETALQAATGSAIIVAPGNVMSTATDIQQMKSENIDERMQKVTNPPQIVPLETLAETPKENITQMITRFEKMGVEQGLDPAQARQFAIDKLREFEQPAPTVISGPAQEEFGVTGGVEGFGQGAKGEQDLFKQPETGQISTISTEKVSEPIKLKEVAKTAEERDAILANRDPSLTATQQARKRLNDAGLQHLWKTKDTVLKNKPVKIAEEDRKYLPEARKLRDWKIEEYAKTKEATPLLNLTGKISGPVMRRNFPKEMKILTEYLSKSAYRKLVTSEDNSLLTPDALWNMDVNEFFDQAQRFKIPENPTGNLLDYVEEVKDRIAYPEDYPDKAMEKKEDFRIRPLDIVGKKGEAIEERGIEDERLSTKWGTRAVRSQFDVGRENTPPAIKIGWIDTRGADVSTPEKTAQAINNWRNPHKELFHILYTKNNKIIAHDIYTSDRPHYSKLPITNEGRLDPKFRQDISSTIERTGAGGIKFVHNHPTGDPKFSDSDISIAKQIKKYFKSQYEGFYSTNHDEMGIVDIKGKQAKITYKDVDLGKSFEIKGPAVGTTQVAMDLLKKIAPAEEGKLKVIPINVKQQPLAVETIKLNEVNVENIGAAIDNIIRKHSGADSFLSTTSEGSSLIHEQAFDGSINYLDMLIDNRRSLRETNPYSYAQTSKAETYEKDSYKKIREEKESFLPSKTVKGSPISQSIGEFEKISDLPKTSEEFKLFNESYNLIKKYAEITGEKYTIGKAIGNYFPDTKNVFLKSMNNISVAIHEITHYLDDVKIRFTEKITARTGTSKNGNPIYDPKTLKERKLLKKFYLEYYPGARAEHPLRKRIEEGFATFVQKFIEQPTEVRDKYGDLIPMIITPGGKYNHPLINEIIKDARVVIAKYFNLDPLNKIGARVMSDPRPVVQTSYMRFRDRMVEEFLDNLYPLERMAQVAGQEMTKLDPSLYARLYNNVPSIIVKNINSEKGYHNFVNGDLKKLYDFNWHTLVKKVHDKGLTDRFAHFLVARRMSFMYHKLDLMKAEAQLAAARLKEILSEMQTGEMTTADIDGLKRTIKEYKDFRSSVYNNKIERKDADLAYQQNKEEFKEFYDMYDKLVRADLNFLHSGEVGLIKDKDYAEMIEKEGYATFKRDIMNEVVGEEGHRPIRTGKTIVSSLLKFKGSDLPIVNPLFSSIQNHAEIMKKGVKQWSYNVVYKLYSRNKDNPLFDAFQELPLKRSYDTRTGKTSYPQDKDPNILMARIGGKRAPLLVGNDIKRVIDDVFTYKDMHFIEKVFINLSRMFTKGTTGLYPPFAVSNIMVDQFSAMAQTMNHYTPIIDQLRLVSKSLFDHDSKPYQYLKEYLSLGGERQTFVGWMDLTPNEYFTRIKSEREGLYKVKEYIDNGFDILALPSAWSEIFTRASEYVKSRTAGKPQIVALEEAGRVSAPFHHAGRLGGGTVGRSALKSIPYFNAALQVLHQYGRTVINEKTRSRALFVLSALTVGLIASSEYFKKKASAKQIQDLDSLHASEKSSYIYLPHPNGKDILKFRIPEQMGFIGNMINMIIGQTVNEQKFRGKDYVDAVTSWIPDQLNFTDPMRMLFSWIPQMVRPAAEVAFNTRTYPVAKPLIYDGMMKREPEFRYYDSTSKLAKKLGSMLDISPIKVDHLIEGYLGRFSRVFFKKDAWRNPLVRKVYFQSGRKLKDFWEFRDRAYKEFETYKYERKVLSEKEQDKIIENYSAAKSISALLRQYRNIEDKDLDTQESYDIQTEILDAIDSIDENELETQ